MATGLGGYDECPRQAQAKCEMMTGINYYGAAEDTRTSDLPTPRPFLEGTVSVLCPHYAIGATSSLILAHPRRSRQMKVTYIKWNFFHLLHICGCEGMPGCKGLYSTQEHRRQSVGHWRSHSLKFQTTAPDYFSSKRVGFVFLFLHNFSFGLQSPHGVLASVSSLPGPGRAKPMLHGRFLHPYVIFSIPMAEYIGLCAWINLSSICAAC